MSGRAGEPQVAGRARRVGPDLASGDAGSAGVAVPPRLGICAGVGASAATGSQSRGALARPRVKQLGPAVAPEDRSGVGGPRARAGRGCVPARVAALQRPARSERPEWTGTLRWVGTGLP